jgi:hypothetical protein
MTFETKSLGVANTQVTCITSLKILPFLDNKLSKYQRIQASYANSTICRTTHELEQISSKIAAITLTWKEDYQIICTYKDLLGNPL